MGLYVVQTELSDTLYKQDSNKILASVQNILGSDVKVLYISNNSVNIS